MSPVEMVPPVELEDLLWEIKAASMPWFTDRKNTYLSYLAVSLTPPLFIRWLCTGRRGTNPLWFVLSALATLFLAILCREVNMRTPIVRLPAVLNSTDCETVIAEANAYSDARGGWKVRMKHREYSTQDVPILELPAAKAIMDRAVSQTLSPTASRFHCADADACELVVREGEPRLVCRDAAPETPPLRRRA